MSPDIDRGALAGLMLFPLSSKSPGIGQASLQLHRIEHARKRGCRRLRPRGFSRRDLGRRRRVRARVAGRLEHFGDVDRAGLDLHRSLDLRRADGSGDVNIAVELQIGESCSRSP